MAWTMEGHLNTSETAALTSSVAAGVWLSSSSQQQQQVQQQQKVALPACND
jgi:hypothetical protein